MRDGSERILSKTSRLTPRERWLSAIALLILLGLGALEAFQWAGAQRDRFELAAADLALVRQQRRELTQDAPDAFDVAQLNALSSWSQHGRNDWLARLKIEQRLVLAATDAGIKDATVAVAEAPEGEPAAPLLRAEVSGSYHGATLVGLLQRISSDRESYVLDRIQVERGDAPEFKLSLLFPVQLDANGPAS